MFDAKQVNFITVGTPNSVNEVGKVGDRFRMRGRPPQMRYSIRGCYHGMVRERSIQTDPANRVEYDRLEQQARIEIIHDLFFALEAGDV